MKRFLFFLIFTISLKCEAQTTTAFVPLKSVWKYLDNGSNQGTVWRGTVFDDTSWPQGQAELGYGDGDEATVVNYGPSSTAKYITTYFRKTFQVTGAASYNTATLRVRRDDGVVIYLNGAEVYRNTMPSGTVTYTTAASAAVTDEVSLFTATVNPALLVEGNNVLAVEIHQSGGTSSDISFDMDFTGTVTGNIPAANAQAVSLNEDTQKAITLTGTDPNGDPLTYAVVTPPAKGSLSGTPPNVTYSPNLNASGADSFSFTVNDGANTSPPATVSLTVVAVNDPPAAHAQSIETAEDTPAAVLLTGSDVESPWGMLADYTQQLYNGNLTGITDGLSGATWNADTGTLFLIRNLSGGAGHSYEYSADGVLLRTVTQSGFQDTEAITWMYGTTYAIAEEDNFQRITICTIAPGQTALERTAAGNVSWTTPVGNLLNFGIESLCYDAGLDRLYYVAEKPNGGSWNIYSMNPATGASEVLCNVIDSIFNAGVATDLSDMAIDRATGTLLLVSHESSRIIRVNRAGTVMEQRGFTTAFTQAEALALTPDRQRLFVGGEPKQFARYALPVNNLTYAVSVAPRHGTLGGLPPLLTYRPDANYHGPDSFSFTVNDGSLNSEAAQVNLSVSPVNDPPMTSPLAIAVEAGEAAAFVLPGVDADGDPLVFEASAPAHGMVSLSGNTATYTADSNYSGADSFTYTVTDGMVTSAPAVVSITVTTFNNAPVAANAAFMLDEDTSAAVVTDASDSEGDPLMWNVITPPAHGTLTGAAPNLTYTPAANYFGTDSFTFTVHDGREVSNTATVTLSINAVPDVPVASAGAADIEAGYPLSLGLTATDGDNDPLTFAITSMPVHGVLTGTPPNVIYTPDVAFAGTDAFSFTATDGTLTSAPAEMTVAVSAYNQPPVAQNSTITIEEDTAATVTLNAADPENQAMVYSITSQPSRGTLSGTPPNLVFTPNTNFSGTDSFTWTAGDGSKVSAPAAASITITPVNDAPTALSFAISTETNTIAPVTLRGSDAENSPLTFAIVTPPAHGTLSGTGPGLTYVPEPGYTGADAFLYTVNDGVLDSVPATVSVTVSPAVMDSLVTAGSSWKYLDNGTNQGTAWKAADFDDSAWASGPAQLGYGDGDEAKVIGYGTDPNNRYITTYFRREFQLPNPGVISGILKLDLLRDDGAVVYLNGTEILRSNMPSVSIAYNQLASASISAPDESTFYTTAVDRSLLVPGRNVLAVEVHQGALNSSDLSFDLRLYESSTSITRGPYLQMTGTNRATVRWRTDIATSTQLTYGTDPAALNLSAVSATPKTEHEVTLTGLTPDTKYYYAAGNSSGLMASGASYCFYTHPPVAAVKPYRFWVLGDPGSGDANQRAVRDAFYAFNGTQRLDGVLMLGDNVYETGTDLEYQTKMFEIYPTMLRNSTFWPTLGNHDAGSASSMTQSGPYYDIFTLPKNAEAGGLPSGTEAYYSFDYGNIHFVCLDSEGTGLSSTGAMAQWLQADLAATAQEWIVAYWHHPAYSKGAHDSDNPTADSGKMKNMREVFVPILESYGADLMLFGHEHNYQRSKFIDGHYDVSSTFNAATMVRQAGLGDPATDAAYIKDAGPHNGAVYQLSGSAGKLTVATLNHPAMAANFNELGSVLLEVNGRELKSRFLNSNGVIRDNFTILHNAPPVATPAVFTGPEDEALPVNLAGSDADNDALTYEILAPPGVGMLTGAAPNLTYTPPPNFSGQTSFQFRVNDGRRNSPAVTVAISITPVNDLPVAAASSVSLDEDSAAGVVLSATDGDGDPLVYTVMLPPAHGVLNRTEGQWIYTPDANWNGIDSFTFFASDAESSSVPAEVSITVLPVNDPPAATAQFRSGSEDTAVILTLQGSDGDADALHYSVVQFPLHGTLDGTAPNLIYTPDPDWNGADGFSFSVSDGVAVSSPAAVAVDIAPVNDTPVAAAVSAAAGEDTASVIALAGSDADGDALSFSVITVPAHGTLGGTAPDLVYTPEPNWNGEDSFSYRVSDGSAISDAGIVTVTVAAANDRPVAAPQALSTQEDTAIPVVITATDEDGDRLTFTISVPPVHGTLHESAGHWTYTPEANWNGTDSFAFTASDAESVSEPAAVTITVLPVNDAPAATGQVQSTPEDAALPVILGGSDGDGDSISFSVLQAPLHGSLAGSAPNLTYIPEPDWSGVDSFTFIVSDGDQTSLPAFVFVEVIPVNDLPVASSQSLLTAEDMPAAFRLSSSDADGDPVEYSILVPPQHGTLSGSGPEFFYFPEADYHGPDNVVYSVSDNNGAGLPGTVSITVESVNDAPAGSPQVLRTEEGISQPVTLTGTDSDGDTLAFTIVTQPAHGLLSGTVPDLIYTPQDDWNGQDSFTFTVSDGLAVSAPVMIAIFTGAINDAPVALAAGAATAEDTATAITLEGTDADGDVLTFSILTPPAHGTLGGIAPNLIYTPETDWNGQDSFSFTVSDGSESAVPADVTIEVTPVNDVPVAESLEVVTDEDAVLPVRLAASDADGDVIAFTVTEYPVHGTLSGNGASLTYTPETNWAGTDSFTYTASDAASSSAPSVVTVAVLPVNDAPLADSQSPTVAEDMPLALVLSGSDRDGDTLSFTVLHGPVHGLLTGVAPDFIYTAEADWNGVDSVTFAVSDGTEVSPPATVSITVASVNDAPAALPVSAATDEDTAAVIRLAGSDADGDALTFTVLTLPAHGTLSGTAPDLTYTPNPGWSGEDRFTFAAFDGLVSSAPAVITVSVSPVNDAPVVYGQLVPAAEDTPVPVSLAADDPDGDALTFNITAGPSHGTLSGSGADLIYTPSADWSGSDSFRFTATDGVETSLPATVDITVAAVNDAPAATALNLTAEVGIAVNFMLRGSDVDGDALSWNVVTPPAFGSLSGTGASLTYTPNPAWSGIDQFLFTAFDGSATSAVAAVTITVASSGPWQLVARTGLTAPGAGGSAFSLLQPDFVSDSFGRASFRGTAGSITGIWTEGPAGLEAVITQGAAAPGTPGAVFDAVTTGPWAAGDGELLVFGKLLAGSGDATTASDLGYWLRTGGTQRLVARENGVVPGMDAAARFSTLAGVATLEAGGVYAFAGTLKANKALGITTANDTGLWGTFGGVPGILAREGSAAPGSADGGVFDTLTAVTLASNGAGQLGFSGAMKVAGSITAANRYGLWLQDPLQSGLVARGGSAAPGTAAGTLFAQPLQASLGEGAMVFRATLTAGTGDATTSSDTGLWILENGSVSLAAREGFQAPGVATGGVFNGFTEGASVNDGNEFAYRTTLRTGAGVTSSNNAGVWVRSRYTGNTQALVARKGTTAPGGGTATFSSFDFPYLTEEGREVFTATLTASAAAGVTASNDRGLWVRTSAGTLALVLREGRSFTLAPGDTRTVSAITMPASRTAGRTPLSSQGRLLLQIAFTDGSSALYHYTLP